MAQTNWTSLGTPGGTLKVFWPHAVQNADGRLEVMLTGSDGNLWHIWQTTPGGTWGTWATLNTPPHAGMNSTPFQQPGTPMGASKRSAQGLMGRCGTSGKLRLARVGAPGLPLGGESQQSACI